MMYARAVAAAKRKKSPGGRPPRTGKAASAQFNIRLTGDELERWTEAAARQGISLSELVRESVELAIARGASR